MMTINVDGEGERMGCERVVMMAAAMSGGRRRRWAPGDDVDGWRRRPAMAGGDDAMPAMQCVDDGGGAWLGDEQVNDGQERMMNDKAIGDVRNE